MLRNPTYTLLTQQADIITETIQNKVTVANTPYLLVTYPRAAERYASIRILQGADYHRNNHHLSIYQSFAANQRSGLSAFHYTANYQCAGQAIIVHAYFNDVGGYLYCHAKLDNAEMTQLDLSPEDESLIKTMAEFFVYQNFTRIFQHLNQRLQHLHAEKSQGLTELETQSRDGVHKVLYITKLQNVINLCSQINELEFYPDLRQRNLLEQQLAFLQGKRAEKKKARRKVKAKKAGSVQVESKLEETHVEEAAEESPAIDLTMQQRQQETQAANEQLVTLEKDKLSVENLRQRKKLLDTLLACCPINNLSLSVKLCKKIDALATLREDAIIQACINGEEKTVINALNEKHDVFLLPKLVSTAAYHQHYELFDQLFKLHKMKQLYVVPLKQVNPPIAAVWLSYLEIAYNNHNLQFFCKLLTEYQQNPNCFNASNLPLALSMVALDDGSEYLHQLLKAGANPNVVFKAEQQNFSFIDTASKKKLSNNYMTESLPSKMAKTYDRIVKELSGQTALHLAVLEEDIVCFDILMEYGADSTLSKPDGYNAFGLAVYKPGAPNEHIINKLLATQKHHIDVRRQKDQATPLFVACASENLPAVKLFLKLNADCFAHHNVEAKVSVTAEPSMRTIATPLMIAMQIGNLPIVGAIVQHLITQQKRVSMIEIQRLSRVIHSDKIRQAVLPLRKYAESRHEADQKTIDNLNTRSVAAFKAKEYKVASRLFKDIFQLAPPDDQRHSFLYGLGSSLWQEGELSEAREKLLECIKLRQQLNVSQDLIQKAQSRLKDIEVSSTQAKRLLPT